MNNASIHSLKTVSLAALLSLPLYFFPGYIVPGYFIAGASAGFPEQPAGLPEQPAGLPGEAAGGENAAPDGGAPAAAAALPNEKCECGEKPALNKLLEQAAISFVGRVEKLDNNPRRPGFIEVTFAVLNRFKGFEEIKTPKVLIYTPKEPSCTYTFRVGLDYLIYASGTPANFKVDICSGSEILENSFTDVERLKRMTTNDPSNRMPVVPEGRYN